MLNWFLKKRWIWENYTYDTIGKDKFKSITGMSFCKSTSWKVLNKSFNMFHDQLSLLSKKWFCLTEVVDALVITNSNGQGRLYILFKKILDTRQRGPILFQFFSIIKRMKMPVLHIWFFQSLSFWGMGLI